jgi:hypothetical protein
LTALACSRSSRCGEATLDRFAWLSLVAIVIALLIPAGLPASMPAGVTGTAGLITTLRPDHLLHRLLTARLLLLTGAMSYSLYLWHWSVVAIAHWTIGIHRFTAPFPLAAIPLSDILEDVQRAYPNFRVLDLFPVMCPGNVCRFTTTRARFCIGTSSRIQASRPTILRGPSFCPSSTAR